MSKPIFNIYTLSDTHFGHGNIIIHANRPFPNQAVMDAKLTANWNATVRPQDMVIVIGDMVWTGGDANKIRDYIKALNGRIILVRGNHDKRTNAFYLSAGIQFICERFVWEYCDKRFLFIHDPHYVTNDDKQNYYAVIHGHLHGNSPLVRKINGQHFINVSVENLNYRPTNLINLMSRLTQGYYEKN